MTRCFLTNVVRVAASLVLWEGLVDNSLAAPPVTTGLGLWVSADAGVNGGAPADGDTVTAWADQLTGDNGVADNLATGSGGPTFESGLGDQLNGRPVIRFNGSTDVLTAPSSVELNLANGFTFFVQVRYNGAGVINPWVLCKDYASGGGGNAGYLLGYNGNRGGISMNLTGTAPDGSGHTPDGSWGDRLTTGGVLPPEGSQLLVGRYDAVSGALSMQVYDGRGVLADVTANQTPNRYVASSTGNFSIGGYLDSFAGNERFNGDVGEVALYGAALSDGDRASVRDYFLDRWMVTDGPALWLQAEAITGVADGAALASWVDRSGFARHATQSDPVTRPLYVASSALVDNKPVVRFDKDSDDFMQVADSPIWQFSDFSLFAVVMFKTETGNWWERALLAQDSGSKWMWTRGLDNGEVGSLFHWSNGPFVRGGAWTPDYNNRFYILGLDKNGADYRFFRDGNADGTGNDGGAIPNVAGSLLIGWAEGGRNFDGDMAEIRVYTNSLDTTARQMVEGQLAWTYGLEGNLPIGHPYRDTSPFATGETRVNNGSGATDVTDDSATLHGELLEESAGPTTVRVYRWPEGGTTNVEDLGTLAVGTFATNVTGLAANTLHYYQCSASNTTSGEVWALTTNSFSTVGVPTIVNLAPTDIGPTVGTARGQLTAGTSGEVTLYWGTTDGVTTPANWSHTNALGTKSQGVAFATNLTGLSSGQIYYYRCFVTNASGVADWADSSTNFTAGAPAILWLRSEAITGANDGDSVSTWPDSSGGARDATQVGAARPTYVASSALAGSKPVVRFNTALGQYLEVADSPLWQFSDFSMFAVVMYKSEPGGWWERALVAQDQGGGGQPKWIWSHDAGSKWHVNPGGLEIQGTSWAPSYNTRFYILSLNKNGAAYSFFRDGSADGTANSAVAIPDAACPLRIGFGEGGSKFDGDMAEVRIYNGSLTTGERQLVEGRLAWAYGLEGNLPIDHPYRYVNPDVPAVTVVVNGTTTDVAVHSATLNGELVSQSAPPTTIRVYWWPDAGTTNVEDLGTVGVATFSTNVTGLTGGTLYHYRCSASNTTSGEVWAPTTNSFTTVGPPTVVNLAATGVGATLATARGQLTAGTSGDVTLYWGPADGLMSPQNWAHTNALGTQTQSVTFATNLTGLTVGTTYHYRCYVTNASGSADWADTAESFTAESSATHWYFTSVLGDWNSVANWTDGTYPGIPKTGQRADIGVAAHNGVTACVKAGDAVAAGVVYLGVDSGNVAGGLEVSGGSLTVSSDGLYVGYNATSTGAVTQTGGSVLAPRVDVGGPGGGAGSYTLSGGTLSITGGGPGYVASSAAASGTVTMTGGMLAASGDWWIGPDGIGAMTQSGGTNNVLGRFRLADHGAGQGTYALSGTGMLIVTNGLSYIGTDSSRTGTMHQTGGTAHYKELHIGSYGPGEYNLSGGAVHAANFYRGYDAHSVFAFTGGTLSADTVHFGITNDGGTLSPGRTNSTGKTQINGNYTMSSPAAALAIQIGGTGQGITCDWLSVSGTAALNGALNVSLVNGYVPGGGASFSIVTAGSVSGTFANAPVSGQVYNLGGASFRVTYSATSVVLSDTNNLLLWLKSDAITGLSNGDAVSVWPDSSGADRDAAQANALWRPTYVASSALIGNKPAVRFTSSPSSYLRVADEVVWQFSDFSMFAVVMYKSETGNWWERPILAQDSGGLKWIWTHNAGSLWHVNPGGVQFEGTAWTPSYNNRFYIVSLDKNGAAYSFFRDGSADGTANNATAIPNVADSLLIGLGEGTSTFDGDMAEIKIYNRSLSESERQVVEGQLAWTYGLQANLPLGHPYRDVNPVGWPGTVLTFK